MAGFYPTGSSPVASVPAGQTGVVYSLTAGYAEFNGVGFTVTYVFPPDRVSWFGLEVLLINPSVARSTWYGLEVLYTDTTVGRVSWFGLEVLRSIAVPRLDDVMVSALW